MADNECGLMTKSINVGINIWEFFQAKITYCGGKRSNTASTFE